MKRTKNTAQSPKRLVSAFAQNLLNKYGIREYDVRLSWVFDEKALMAATGNTQNRKISAGLDAPPRLKLIGS